ncbi:MAG TPA: N-acetyltransferase [Nitrospiraceae bacterium]|nr:N-acetyltransferase [Nitrospiraceae bacterium]
MLEVLPVWDKRAFKEFLVFPFRLYKDNPFWVPPLLSEVRAQFSSENPFFKHTEILPFIAKIDRKTVGRIVAIHNKNYIDFHQESAGFFGFFECIEDLAVAKALLKEVSNWLKNKGLNIMLGPMNFSSNEEWGLLINGFDRSPMLMMPYNFPYYAGLIEGCGLKKAKDLYAYIMDIPDSLPEKALRVADIAERHRITVRPINTRAFQKEMAVFKQVYNSILEKNWGFIPMDKEEIDYMGSRLKSIIVAELALVAEHNGEPIGFMLILPDFNFVLKKLRGRLTPIGILKALWYSRKIKDLRLLILGVKEGYRKQGVDALLFREGLKAIKKKGGYRRIEFSWILEDNIPTQRIVEMFLGRLYKTYRIYENIL